LISHKPAAARIRCHGDYHLGQVLYTGNNFVIIDFEGEPARPISERRLKRCPLQDVAGMLRSFHYATQAALSGQARTVLRPEDSPVLERWARFWYSWVAAAFLKSYLKTAGQAEFLPPNGSQLESLLHIYMLEKAVYEVGYELNNRPGWVKVPLQGILQLLSDPE
jgi:maltose alpha-D-glucosyltransferase/alpha-amylase